MPNKAIDQQLLLQALAWFIVNDETNAGGDWEDTNHYWLQNRRHAYQFFNGWEEAKQLAKEFENSLSGMEYSKEYENQWKMK